MKEKGIYRQARRHTERKTDEMNEKKETDEQKAKGKGFKRKPN